MNNTYNCSIDKKPIDVDYFALIEKIKTNPKAPKFKVGKNIRIAKYYNIFGKGYTKNWSRKIFVIHSVLKNNF